MKSTFFLIILLTLVSCGAKPLDVKTSYIQDEQSETLQIWESDCTDGIKIYLSFYDTFYTENIYEYSNPDCSGSLSDANSNLNMYSNYITKGIWTIRGNGNPYVFTKFNPTQMYAFHWNHIPDLEDLESIELTPELIESGDLISYTAVKSLPVTEPIVSNPE